MDINATLFAQVITFVLFIGFTMKFVWPHLLRLMEERREKIADGLAAAEQGKRDLELAKIKSKELLDEAKTEASRIIEQAEHRGSQIVEEAKGQARVEGDRLLQLAKGEIEQEYNTAREGLLREVSGLVMVGAERILQKEIDKSANDRLVDELCREIQ